MAKNNFPDQRRKSGTALRALATILSSKGVCSDVAPLNAAAEQCSRTSANGEKAWGYDINNLTFQLKTPKGTIPSKVRDFRLELSMSIAGRFDSEPDDQFSKLELNVEKYAQGLAGAELKAAWHFDRHIIDTKKDSPHITEDIHPLYHFQFGGARMSKIADRLGQTLLLDPPRLMHPPMDGILAIDFVLANYAGAIWKTLRNDMQYENLIVPQFKKFWKPYFDAVAGSWTSPRTLNSTFLCPFVLK
jgi:hypothetical protein